MNVAWWTNTLWMKRCGSAARDFALATGNLEAVQRECLRRLLAENADTAFGRQHGFHSGSSVSDYQSRMHIRTYDDFAPWIERIAKGERNVLTAERVQLLEPTSGSTSAEKLIPYSATLKRQFQAAIGAWIHDLFRQRPAVRQGRAYWSVSPAFGPQRRTAGGLPIGFDNDQAYLGGLEQLLARRVLVMPKAVAVLRASETFRYVTLLHLLAADDLSLISVWSPTFLTSLLANLPAWWERLCYDLRCGRLSGPGAQGLERKTREALSPRRSVRRADQLQGMFRTGLAQQWPSAIWPRLQLISCWADASAGLYVPSLRQQFPAAEIQGKGLISTEAFVSFPSYSLQGMPLAATSHFFEFVEMGSEAQQDKKECVRLAHELEAGGSYRVVVTTGGGLYRYDLGDIVRVTGFAARCPMLRFLGRTGGGSDLVGEKLSEPFVRDVLERLQARFELSPCFSLLIPAAGAPPSYRLYLQLPVSASVALDQHRLAALLEQELSENPYYRLSVQLQQLAPAEVAILDAHAPSAWRSYEERCLAAGQRAGNIKPRALDTNPDWESLLAPFVRSISGALREQTSPR